MNKHDEARQRFRRVCDHTLGNTEPDKIFINVYIEQSESIEKRLQELEKDVQSVYSTLKWALKTGSMSKMQKERIEGYIDKLSNVGKDNV
jgi:hypothetical protein